MWANTEQKHGGGFGYVFTLITNHPDGRFTELKSEILITLLLHFCLKRFGLKILITEKIPADCTEFIVDIASKKVTWIVSPTHLLLLIAITLFQLPILIR